MRKNLLSFVLGIFSFMVFADIFNITYDNATKHYMPNGWDSKAYAQEKKDFPIANKIWSFLIAPSLGFFDPLTGRCTKEKRGKFIRREYFSCNKAQILLSDIIYGENGEKK